MVQPSDKSILKRIRVVAPGLGPDATVRELRLGLTRKLIVELRDLPSKVISRLYIQVCSEEKAADLAQEQSADESDETKSHKKQSQKRKSSEGITELPVDSSPEGVALAALRAYVKASGHGPRLYKGLKDLETSEQVRQLKERLRAVGAEYEGEYPTQKEIDAAGDKAAAMRDMEGIDQSLIIESGKRRRGSDNASPSDGRASPTSKDQLVKKKSRSNHDGSSKKEKENDKSTTKPATSKPKFRANFAAAMESMAKEPDPNEEAEFTF